MSHRALRRLRQEREPQIVGLAVEDGDDNDDEDDESVGATKVAMNAFAFMDDDDDDEEDDESSSASSDQDGNGNESSGESDKEKEKLGISQPSVAKCASTTKPVGCEVEDLDALLEEYKLQDQNQEEATENTNQERKVLTRYNTITQGMDPRDLDIDFVMRTSLLGTSENNNSGKAHSRKKQIPIFGPPRDNWQRPPHYVGGGMGMISYHDESKQRSTVNESSSPRSLPWPYSEMKEGDQSCPPATNWFKFIQSDSYRRDLLDLETIKSSGDANALAMFVAHHPFVVEALLQLSIVLYQTSQRQEGLSILKRSLWVFECAALNSFLKVNGRVAFLDCDLEENATFFDALFRLTRVAYVAGLSRTALAASRFILSLDPLRDPMNVLLAIDHFALLCNSDSCNEWPVGFVESKEVYITYRDVDHPDGFDCDLLDLPNWSYSYALALFRIHKENPSDENSKQKADEAIQASLARFPTVIGQLLASNDVDTTNRSLQMDWPAVLDLINDLTNLLRNTFSDVGKSDPVVRACSYQAYETVVQIFVQQNHALWGANDVMKWIYSNLVILKEHSDGKRSVVPLSPAIMRFARCDPSDFEDKFQTMPAEANPLDGNVVAHALVVQPNRPRLIQRGQRVAGDAMDDVEMAALAGWGQHFAGPPTVQIDPDLPLLEVFWRSALPWAHVEGVPPPNRDN